jgi:hypothetical protein
MRPDPYVKLNPRGLDSGTRSCSTDMFFFEIRLIRFFGNLEKRPKYTEIQGNKLKMTRSCRDHSRIQVQKSPKIDESFSRRVSRGYQRHQRLRFSPGKTPLVPQERRSSHVSNAGRVGGRCPKVPLEDRVAGFAHTSPVVCVSSVY